MRTFFKVLGWLLILQLFGIPWAVINSFWYLANGLWKHALAELAYVPLNFILWAAKAAERIMNSPIIGIGYLAIYILVLVLGIWLVRGAKLPKRKLLSEDTIRCFNCGKQVADETVVCPWCNAQLRTKRGSE